MSNSAQGSRHGVFARTARHSGRRSRRSAIAAVAVLASIVALLNAGPASAAVAATLSASAIAGNPTVTFTATVTGAGSGDTGYVCFGDEAANACDVSHVGSTAVDLTAASSAGGATLSHQYASEGIYSAVLFEVQAGAITASTPVSVTVTIDATAHLTSTVTGLTAVFDGTSSTASDSDTWWACFGDNSTCSATQPDLSGTLNGGSHPLASVSHTYAAPGTYPASLTVVGPSATTTAAAPTTVNFPHPTAVLSADSTSGSGSLPVTFDGSKSVVAAGDSWQFCYGDRAGCSATTSDDSGTISATSPTIALSTTAHNYTPGNYTATLWLTGAGTTTNATVAITVAKPIAGPDVTCTLASGVRTCDLFAKGNGSVVAGTGADRKTIPFWGFTTSDADKPVLGGPELVATEGERLAFTVHNELDPRAGTVSITVPDLIGSPDPNGVAPGSTGPSNPSSGPFTLTRPGTYIYEAGLTPGGARQVAMGMSGVLIVRPSVPTASNSARCAYDAAVNADCVTNKDPNNYFDREKLVVLNELDADFAADPFGTDTGNYHPTNYFLDGVAYDTSKTALDPSDLAFDPTINAVRFDAARGDTVLLRYADLGLREHAMNLLGVPQTETARDAHLLPGTQTHTTEFLNAGETSDAFVSIPGDAPKNAQYPIFDAGLHLNNGAAGGLGGMYGNLNVINGVTASDRGPVGTAATVTPTFSASTPNVDNGQIPTLAVTGTFSAQPTAAGATPTVASLQWALDGVPGTGGLWQHTTAAPDPAGASTASLSFTVSADLLTQLLGTEPDRVFGDHTVWLQALDSNGVAGPAIGASFALARRDAVISGLSIDPAVTNGNTQSAQGPVSSTSVTADSNDVAVAAGPSTLNVKSTAGFPADCTVFGDACQLTVGMTIASGPAAGDTEFGQFHYTGLTTTTFTGVTADPSVVTGNHVFRTGNTVALDVIPAGYIAVDGTATSSLPGWLISAAQACVVAAGTETAPVAADANKCATSAATVTNLPVDTPDSLLPIAGFINPPKLPNGVSDGARFWVMVRAQEGPDGTPCSVPGSCRWSPWLYSQSATAVDTATYQKLTVVKKGPETGIPTITPAVNNGFTAASGNLGLFDSFNVKATATSTWANIDLAEAFLDTTSHAPGTTVQDPVQCTSQTPDLPTGCVVYGRGAEMTPAGGKWNVSTTQASDAFLPLSALQSLPDGLVRVWVHARDIAGNWGPFSSTDLVLDKTPPTVDSFAGVTASTTTAGASQAPRQTGALQVTSTAGFPGAGSIVITGAAGGAKTYAYTSLTATQFLGVTGPAGSYAAGLAVTATTPSVVLRAHDVLVNGAASGLVGAEWFVGADPGEGHANPVTLATGSSGTFPGPANSAAIQSYTLSGLPHGSVHVRVVDAAGNWSAVSNGTV
ncbi:hypothetical protein M6D93_11935 [Jatrophihabitans telluris]|uniref:PKD domain-containing protein n=1 Tax=Jatrophihabitans telluris TaxID=2038343 RepID=A0ABY4QVZ3_9ACTN|nr:hypothetical protein [Jatrophihabitans telluris]UQX87016.1 hypothetical protein M6D93_11935 [Jatrophihabitans telluris]